MRLRQTSTPVEATKRAHCETFSEFCWRKRLRVDNSELKMIKNLLRSVEIIYLISRLLAVIVTY